MFNRESENIFIPAKLFQDRVPTASVNQGKLKGIFPVREKSGNLLFFSKIREFFMTQYFLYFDGTIYFHQ